MQHSQEAARDSQLRASHPGTVLRTLKTNAVALAQEIVQMTGTQIHRVAQVAESGARDLLDLEAREVAVSKRRYTTTGVGAVLARGASNSRETGLGLADARRTHQIVCQRHKVWAAVADGCHWCLRERRRSVRRVDEVWQRA